VALFEMVGLRSNTWRCQSNERQQSEGDSGSEKRTFLVVMSLPLVRLFYSDATSVGHVSNATGPVADDAMNESRFCMESKGESQ
jgi:hypothetical protein